MRTLLDDLLDMQKVQTGHIQVFLEDLPIQLVIDRCVEKNRVWAENTSLKLEVEAPGSLPPVRMDPRRIEQAIWNLLSNAVKFCDGPNPTVKVAAEIEGVSLLVKITDNGPGVPDGVEDVIFEKFQQVGDTLTNKPKGTGLGLPISRQIVEHFGGKIWFEKVTQGADFRFTLPLTRSVRRPLSSEYQVAE